MNNSGASYVAAPTGTAIQFTASNRTVLSNGATAWGTGGQYSLLPCAGAAFSSLNSWTESVWINMPAADSGVTMYFFDARGTGSYGFNQSFNNGGDTLYTRIEQAGGGGDLYEGGSNFTIPTDTWALLTTTVGAGVYNIYLDGVLVGGATYSGTAQFMDAGQNFVIGGHANGGAYPFNGSVGDFTIYDVALTQAQILAAYQAVVPPPPPAGTLSTQSPVQLASGAALDLAGYSQTILSLSNLGLGGGTVTSSVTGGVALTLVPNGGSTTFSGVIQNGRGTVALVMNGNGTQVLAGNNTYSGGTTVQSGVLSVSNDDNLGASAGALTLSGGTFQASTGFTLGASRPVSVGAATIDVPSGTLIFAGTIADAGATPGTLTKTGTGVLQLDGNSTYSGATAINVGTLAGTGTLASTVTVNSGAFIAPGDNTSGNFGGAGTLTLGGLTLNTGAQVDLDLGTSGNDLLAVNGVLTLGVATVNIQPFGTLTGGVYEVMSYGTLGGNVSTLLAGNLPVGFSGIFSNNAALDQIDLELFGGRRPGPAATARPGTPRRRTGA